MFINSVKITNFRLFKNTFELLPGVINVPDNTNEGSGLTVFVGENGTGKTSILDALTIPFLDYKSDSVCLDDFNKFTNEVEINISTKKMFTVKKCIKGNFEADGFLYKAKLRSRGSPHFLVGTIVSDSYFLPNSLTFDPTKNDFRKSVNNPFSGPRFNENSFLFIDKNRYRQLGKGVFSDSRFDKLLDDFNFQYQNKNSPKYPNLNRKLLKRMGNIGNPGVTEAFNKFKELTGKLPQFYLIDNYLPFKNSEIGYVEKNNHELSIEKMGSGYPMVLAIMMQYYITKQSEKDLIIFIDEPELHLHPRLQKQLVNLILDYSKTTQIVLSTHSPEFLKDLRLNKFFKINVLKKITNNIKINPIEKYVLPSPSIAETNYVAFNVDSMEYYNELYGHLMEITNSDNIPSLDRKIRKGQTLVNWERGDGQSQELTIHSCIRNKFHHPENTLNDDKFSLFKELHNSTKFLRNRILRLK